MLNDLSGMTRVYAVIGHPIAQVQSPPSMTRALQAKGRNAVLVPLHVEPANVDDLIDALGRVHNFDGILATVPHKFTAYRHAATATDRAHLLGAANVLRRNADRTWHADMLDGISMIAAIEQAGGKVKAQRALLIGAGGAGSAIALSLVEAGVAELAIHDTDAARRDALIERLRAGRTARVIAGGTDPGGFTLVINATAVGMSPGDPLPVIAERLAPDTFVADVITLPIVTPLLDVARRLGCGTQTGIGMHEAELDLMADFLLAAPA